MSYSKLGRKTLHNITKNIIYSNPELVLLKRAGKTYTIMDKNDVNYGNQITTAEEEFYVKINWQHFVNTSGSNGFKLENLPESMQISDVLRIHSIDELKLMDTLTIKNSEYIIRKVNYWRFTDFWISYAVRKDYLNGYFE